MKQSPEYLRNQSRYVHSLHRRYRRFLNWSVGMWCVFFGGLAIASALSITFRLGWGLGPEDCWAGVAFATFGGFFWLFGRVILSVLSAICRRMYGANPEGASE